MSQKAAVIVGLSTSNMWLKHHEDMFSSQNYGNYLPELWMQVRDVVLTEYGNGVSFDPLTEALKRKNDEEGWVIMTHDMDGLAEKAGIDPLVEMRGNVFKGRCLRCQTVMDIGIDDFEKLADGEVFSCVKCGKPRVRPDIVLPGERMKHRRLVRDWMKDLGVVICVDRDSIHPDCQKLLEEVSTVKFVKRDEISDWIADGLQIF